MSCNELYCSINIHPSPTTLLAVILVDTVLQIPPPLLSGGGGCGYNSDGMLMPPHCTVCFSSLLCVCWLCVDCGQSCSLVHVHPVPQGLKVPLRSCVRCTLVVSVLHRVYPLFEVSVGRVILFSMSELGLLLQAFPPALSALLVGVW